MMELTYHMLTPFICKKEEISELYTLKKTAG